MGVRILKTPFRSPQSPYPRTSVSPNWITQSLFAVLAGLQVPFPCTETHELGEELFTSPIRFSLHSGDSENLKIAHSQAKALARVSFVL